MALALAVGCGGNPYGYDRTYVTYGDEDDYLEQAQPVPYEDVRRDPAGFEDTMLGWFGVVTGLTLDRETGRATVRMSHRIHRERHLCSDERASSCRVTVSDRESGPFSAVLTLRPEDQAGDRKMWEGSLVRIYGTPTGEFDDQGGPVISVRWYRHWPTGTYVTTGAAGSMRR
jgi:hypothetical protein